MLHIGIGTEGKSLLMTPLRVKFDEVACDVLDTLLGLIFQAIPRAGTQSRQPWRLSRVLPAVFTYLIKRVNRNVNLIIVLVNNAYHFLIRSEERRVGKECR